MKWFYRVLKKEIVLSFLLIFLLQITPFGEETDHIKVLVNGKTVLFDVNPVIVDGRTLVPLRAIFEALDIKVEWKQETKTVFGNKDGKLIILQIGNKNAFINSGLITLDVPARLIENRTVVPARFIAESIGAKVEWQSDSKTVIISTE